MSKRYGYDGMRRNQDIVSDADVGYNHRMESVRERAWKAFQVVSKFTDEPKSWIMACLPLVFGQDPKDVIAGRMCSTDGLLPPTAWTIALDERFADHTMLGAGVMPAPACRMSHALLGWAGFRDASPALKHLPLPVGAAFRVEVGEQKLIFATRPDSIDLDRLKRWFGAALLAAEVYEIRSLAIPMPSVSTEDEARIVAATIVSEARAHHGFLYNIWPVFASESQRDAVLLALDRWVQDDLGNLESAIDAAEKRRADEKRKADEEKMSDDASLSSSPRVGALFVHENHHAAHVC